MQLFHVFNVFTIQKKLLCANFLYRRMTLKRREMKIRGNCFIKIFCLISAFAAWFPGNTAIGQHSQAVDTFIIEGNRKAVHYQGDRLVFYDGIDNNAKPIADVNCFEQSIISSKQGKYFATCSQFINRTGPACIYNNKGEKIGEFNLERPWKVWDISDNGELVSLHIEPDGPDLYINRLSDKTGNILADYSDIFGTHISFTLDGMPVVWGAKSTSLFFISIFDNKGKIIDEYNSLDYIRETHSSKQAEIILILHQVKDNRITIWNRLNDSAKTIEILNGSDNIHGPAISRNGKYAVLQVFREEISLIDAINCSEILYKTVDESFAGSFKHILDIAVSDEGNILVMGHSEGVVGYCVMDKTGKLIKSKVLDDFEHDGYIYRNFRIQELTQDKFAIVHKTNKIEIIDLK